MASMNEKDYYEILGVSKDATKEEIRHAFQQKARKLHPDVNKEPDAEERFKEVSEAYAVLSDDDKRARYDAMRSGSIFSSPGSSTGSYGDPYGGWSESPFGFGFDFGFGGSPFQGQRRSKSNAAYKPKAGADVVYNLNLDSESAAKGCQKGVTYQRYVTCDVCHGSGSEVSEHAKTCPMCGGSGHIDVDLSSIFGAMGFGGMQVECPECEGSGKVVSDPCHACSGTGRTLSASETVVDVPAGSHDGDEIKIAGMGNAGTNGEATGDFVARVSIAEERVSAPHRMAFQMIGFGIPFLVFGALMGILYSVMYTALIPIVLGIIMLVKYGITKHNKYWWRNAGRYLLAGISNGSFIALFMVLMMSCSTGLFRRF